MGAVDIYNIPNDIIQAARLLETYFKQSGIEEWEFMGVCSREIAFKQQDQIKKLQTEIKILENRNKRLFYNVSYE